MPSLTSFIIVALVATVSTAYAKPIAQVQIDGPELHFPPPHRVKIPPPFTITHRPWTTIAIHTPTILTITRPLLPPGDPVSLLKRSRIVTSTPLAPTNAASSLVETTIPCGCWNDCRFVKFLPDRPSPPNCPLTCRPELLCDFNLKPLIDEAENRSQHAKRDGTEVGNGAQQLDISIGIGNIKRDGSEVNNNGVEQPDSIIGVGSGVAVDRTIKRRAAPEMHCYPFPCEDVLEPLDISALEILSGRTTTPRLDRRASPLPPRPTGGSGSDDPKPPTTVGFKYSAQTSWGSYSVGASAGCVADRCTIGLFKLTVKTKQ